MADLADLVAATGYRPSLRGKTEFIKPTHLTADEERLVKEAWSRLIENGPGSVEIPIIQGPNGEPLPKNQQQTAASSSGQQPPAPPSHLFICNIDDVYTFLSLLKITLQPVVRMVCIEAFVKSSNDDVLHRKQRLALLDIIQVIERCKTVHKVWRQKVEGRPLDDDLLEAFVAIGGGEDTKGSVNMDRLRQIVEDFNLNVDVDSIADVAGGISSAVEDSPSRCGASGNRHRPPFPQLDRDRMAEASSLSASPAVDFTGLVSLLRARRNDLARQQHSDDQQKQQNGTTLVGVGIATNNNTRGALSRHGSIVLPAAQTNGNNTNYTRKHSSNNSPSSFQQWKGHHSAAAGAAADARASIFSHQMSHKNAESSNNNNNNNISRFAPSPQAAAKITRRLKAREQQHSLVHAPISSTAALQLGGPGAVGDADDEDFDYFFVDDDELLEAPAADPITAKGRFTMEHRKKMLKELGIDLLDSNDDNNEKENDSDDNNNKLKRKQKKSNTTISVVAAEADQEVGHEEDEIPMAASSISKMVRRTTSSGKLTPAAAGGPKNMMNVGESSFRLSSSVAGAPPSLKRKLSEKATLEMFKAKSEERSSRFEVEAAIAKRASFRLKRTSSGTLEPVFLAGGGGGGGGDGLGSGNRPMSSSGLARTDSIISALSARVDEEGHTAISSTSPLSPSAAQQQQKAGLGVNTNNNNNGGGGTSRKPSSSPRLLTDEEMIQKEQAALQRRQMELMVQQPVFLSFMSYVDEHEDLPLFHLPKEAFEEDIKKMQGMLQESLMMTADGMVVDAANYGRVGDSGQRRQLTASTSGGGSSGKKKGPLAPLAALSLSAAQRLLQQQQQAARAKIAASNVHHHGQAAGEQQQQHGAGDESMMIGNVSAISPAAAAVAGAVGVVGDATGSNSLLNNISNTANTSGGGRGVRLSYGKPSLSQSRAQSSPTRRFLRPDFNSVTDRYKSKKYRELYNSLYNQQLEQFEQQQQGASSPVMTAAKSNGVGGATSTATVTSTNPPSLSAMQRLASAQSRAPSPAPMPYVNRGVSPNMSGKYGRRH